MPTSVGLIPFQKPNIPSRSNIFRAMATGCPDCADSSPTAAEEDCNCVLITSSGLVMQDAIVPAAPPDRRLNSFIRDAVMVRVAASVDPPRHDDLPPRSMLVVLLAPPSGMLSGVSVGLLASVHLLD